jgi:Tol biopolymer transport system component
MRLNGFRLRNRRNTCLAVAVCAAVTLSCSDTAGPATEPMEQLLFISARVETGNATWTNQAKDIFRMPAVGSGAVNLTQTPVTYRSLSASRDGSRVAYIRQSGCYAVWTMNADGSSSREVAGFDEFRCVHLARISPDGSQIAFTSSRQQLGWLVWVVNADGTNPRNVTGDLAQTGSSWMAGWSHDGRVVFHHLPAINTVRTYIARPDGSDRKPLFDRAGDYAPAWSPDGSKVAFISDREGTPRLFVMNADGSTVRKLADVPGEHALAGVGDIWSNDHNPWSPDGARIVFRTTEGTTSSLHVIKADGTGLLRLTEPHLDARFNGWSRSGRWIAFTSLGTPTRDVHVIEPDGSGLRNVSASNWNDSDALWLPAR